MKGKRAKINSIMLQTDFREIKDFFLSQNVTWKNDEGNEYIPSVKEIEAKALEMLQTAANSSTQYFKMVSGNLLVRKNNISLELCCFVSYRYA